MTLTNVLYKSPQIIPSALGLGEIGSMTRCRYSGCIAAASYDRFDSNRGILNSNPRRSTIPPEPNHCAGVTLRRRLTASNILGGD